MLHGTGSWCLRRFFHTAQRVTDKKLLDSLQLCVQGGSGGKGNSKHAGLGGDGGSVIFKGTGRRRLRGLKQAYEGKVIKADDGKNAEAARILGDCAKDRLIEVPVGISVSTRKGRLLGDINAPGDLLRVATGAKGGGPENGFRARVSQFQYVNLDLKLVADVGLVGFPNAGKSTLLTRLSNANPKIASYPFTTMQPQLGAMSFEEDEHLSLIEGRSPRRITIADLPGLIEGASNNVGLGHEFLKHVERTKVLLFVIDVNGFYFGTERFPKARDPFQSICLLLEELRHYDASLLSRPALLCVNKVENDAGVKALRRLVVQLNDFDASLEAAFSSAEELKRLESLPPPQFRDIHAISAEKRINLKPVIKNLFNMVLEQENTETDKVEEEEEEKEETETISSSGVRGRL